MQATLQLDTQHHAGEIDPRIFSGFVEHLGRCVYEGIYDPGSPLSDANGFRTDVLAALAKLKMPLMRYPGGNFVSAYDWVDGIGPRTSRPRRPDFAWRSLETNQFGTDEFMTWCKQLGTAPMMAINAYLHYAVIYRRSPVGLGMISIMKEANHPAWDEKFNRSLQELAWEIAKNYPPSGVAASGNEADKK